MAFTAVDVKNLRELTGVGMMDCKKALTESDGDVDKAIDWLREKGLAAAQKKAGRIAAEGVALAVVINGVGVIVEVNAETDFVAKNEKFIDFVKGVAQAVAQSRPSDVEALLAAEYPGAGKTVQEQLQEMILVIGENLAVRRFAIYTTGISIPYVHAGGKIGVIVNLAVDGISNDDAIVELGKDLAMQVAAMRPTYLVPEDVGTGEIDKEREIQLGLALEENRAKGLPEDKSLQIAQKKVDGRIAKFYEEICLLSQPFVKENKISVGKHVQQVANELGGSITVTAFTRYEKGEGIEKKQEDFAAEIAKLTESK
ncbi:MAG: translation elongation factor Ts [Oscillospiraceae bacterium]|jgi:elongation factor Ts|nr:translation elongation factor Ts [Oscillospiraceae bacterium]